MKWNISEVEWVELRRYLVLLQLLYFATSVTFFFSVYFSLFLFNIKSFSYKYHISFSFSSSSSYSSYIYLSPYDTPPLLLTLTSHIHIHIYSIFTFFHLPSLIKIYLTLLIFSWAMPPPVSSNRTEVLDWPPVSMSLVSQQISLANSRRYQDGNVPELSIRGGNKEGAEIRTLFPLNQTKHNLRLWESLELINTLHPFLFPTVFIRPGWREKRDQVSAVPFNTTATLIDMETI